MPQTTQPPQSDVASSAAVMTPPGFHQEGNQPGESGKVGNVLKAPFRLAKRVLGGSGAWVRRQSKRVARRVVREIFTRNIKAYQWLQAREPEPTLELAPLLNWMTSKLFVPATPAMSLDLLRLAANQVVTPESHEAAAATTNWLIEKLIRPFHQNVTWGDRLLTLDKSTAIADDPKFQEAFATFRGKHQYDQYNGPETILWRLNTLIWAARVALNLEGDFVECGVFKGDMSYTIAKCLDFENVKKTFYLYDSFEGFSPRHSSPKDFPPGCNLIEYANKFYQAPNLYEDVCARFRGYSNIKVIRGFVPEALEIACPEKISFMHIDLNSPAAEVGCLEQLFDRVVPGGVVVFDDYGWKVFAAQKIAEDAFFAKRGYLVFELPTGQGMVVKRGDAGAERRAA